MDNTRNDLEEILYQQVSGFHRYCLEEPIHLSYVSRSFCEMIGMSEAELLDESRDRYASMIHPADQKKYADFLHKLAQAEQTAAEEYRIIKKDGTVIYVQDTAVSQMANDETMGAGAVLTDITDLKKQTKDLQFLNETIPCGFLKYTCEKQPRITYINQNMKDLLRYSEAADGELDYLEMCKSNIFLMIPMEERRKFSKYLNRVYSADAPIAGEMTLLRCDGTRAYVFGWVTKTVNEQGQAEFQSVCMDVTDRHQIRRSSEIQRYLRGLSDVYDKIFEFNLNANTVKCLHCDEGSSFKQFQDIAMQMEDAVERFLLASVQQEDRHAVRDFFKGFCGKHLYQAEAKPPQITYKARSSDGRMKQYSGIFIKVDDAVSFFCCRELRDTADMVALKKENTHLKESMQDLVRQFSDGIAAFEVSPEGMVKPLYATENVCNFFGYSEDEWLRLTEQFTPLENFVMYSEARYEDFAQLLRKGEALFTYYDYQAEKEKQMKAVFSQKEANKRFSRYVMLYPVEDAQQEPPISLPENRRVFIRTFGYFDVFVGDKPVAFSNKKSKELLALLVDRKGGYITSEEAIGFLWEDEPANSVTFSRYRKVALRLKNTLEEYGISNIIESVDGKRRIVPENVQCDLYNYLSGKKEYAQLFKGSYLTNYSWAEVTLGELIPNSIYNQTEE